MPKNGSLRLPGTYGAKTNEKQTQLAHFPHGVKVVKRVKVVKGAKVMNGMKGVNGVNREVP